MSVLHAFFCPPTPAIATLPHLLRHYPLAHTHAHAHTRTHHAAHTRILLSLLNSFSHNNTCTYHLYLITSPLAVIIVNHLNLCALSCVIHCLSPADRIWLNVICHAKHCRLLICNVVSRVPTLCHRLSSTAKNVTRDVTSSALTALPYTDSRMPPAAT